MTITSQVLGKGLDPVLQRVEMGSSVAGLRGGNGHDWR